jgi:DNA repair protein RadA
MVDSPHHPEEEVIFALGEAGVIDPEDADKKTKKTTKKTTTKKSKESETEDALETSEIEATVETPDIEDALETSEIEATVETDSDDSESIEE